MALITQTPLTSGSSGTNGTSVSTASVSPTANRLVIVAVFGGAATPTNATDPTSVSGAGLTFTKLKAQNNTTTFGLNTSLWYAMSASPSTGAITITYPNTQDLFIWSVFELAGVNVAGGTGSNAVNSNTASNQDISGSLTTLGTTLSAFGSSNNGAICATINARATTAATATPDTGWTEIHDLSLVSGGIAFALETQWRDSNDTSPSETWSAAGAIQIVAAEIVAATSSGTLARTNANDTSSANGTTTVIGVVARTNANDTSAASGTTTIIGTVSRTNANDSSAASGTTTIIGVISTTNANDTVSASGSVGSAVSGTLAYTNLNDSVSANGTTVIAGVLSITNNNDTLAASGNAGTPTATKHFRLLRGFGT